METAQNKAFTTKATKHLLTITFKKKISLRIKHFQWLEEKKIFGNFKRLTALHPRFLPGRSP